VAGDTKHIIQSLVVNGLIAAAKGVGAAITGSGAMLAETIHSGADCGNQLLLLLGVKRAQKPPDAAHPLGYGRAVYFWSFMVALLLFTGGGVFSIYEGIHKLMHPEPVQSILIAVVILVFSIGFEGYATFSNIVEANKRRGTQPFWQYLRQTKDSDFVVVMGENSAATVGLILALIAIGLAYVTQDPRWDALGSLAIGLVLVAVAVFLAVEVKSLLVGEAADPTIEAAVEKLLAERTELGHLLKMFTIQQGPGEVMVSIKVHPREGQSARDLCNAINAFENDLRQRVPQVRWVFVEPDLSSEASIPSRPAA
jgi:cation diffusion facilitator family transporter